MLPRCPGAMSAVPSSFEDILLYPVLLPQAAGLLTAYQAPGTILGPRGKAVSSPDKGSAPTELTFEWGRGRQGKHTRTQLGARRWAVCVMGKQKARSVDSEHHLWDRRPGKVSLRQDHLSRDQRKERREKSLTDRRKAKCKAYKWDCAQPYSLL